MKKITKGIIGGSMAISLAIAGWWGGNTRSVCLQNFDQAKEVVHAQVGTVDGTPEFWAALVNGMRLLNSEFLPEGMIDNINRAPRRFITKAQGKGEDAYIQIIVLDADTKECSGNVYNVPVDLLMQIVGASSNAPQGQPV